MADGTATKKYLNNEKSTKISIVILYFIILLFSFSQLFVVGLFQFHFFPKRAKSPTAEAR